mgnify:CR=1 FL=1
MPVTGSGEIKLIGDVNNEINGNTTDTNVSLTTLSTGAGKDAPHGLTEFYGYSDVVAPTVTTSANSSVGSTSLVANGNVTATGGQNVAQGFYVGTSSSYASNTKYTKYYSGAAAGAFNLTISSLTPASTYYVTAWASNSAGESVGSTVSSTLSYPTPTSFKGVAAQNQGPTGSWGDKQTTFGYWYSSYAGYVFLWEQDWWTSMQYKNNGASVTSGLNQGKFYAWGTSGYFNQGMTNGWDQAAATANSKSYNWGGNAVKTGHSSQSDAITVSYYSNNGSGWVEGYFTAT